MQKGDGVAAGRGTAEHGTMTVLRFNIYDMGVFKKRGKEDGSYST